LSPDASQVIARFRALHEAGCFVLPNPWDVGSAVLLERLGFAALATTSAGFAFSRGRPDELSSLRRNDLPVNVLVSSPDPHLSLERLAAQGVRRVSVGSGLARVAWGAVLRASRQLLDGSFDGLEGAASFEELNATFGTGDHVR
jgi:2-methylisocitrate lyase-like PEP mutase family enzyme